MKRRLAAGVIMAALLSVSCGGSDPADLAAAAGTCLAGDPNCEDLGDGGAASPLPDTVSLGDPNDPDAPVSISFGGFFFSDGQQSQLCGALEESFPPQCGSTVISIEAPLDVVLEHVAESYGNPDDARINIDQGIYWTDDWVNLAGRLEANRLVLD